MKEAIIALEALTIKAGAKTLLENISFSVSEGEAWAITGPSGSGKTTLGKVLAGYYPVEQETLSFRLPASSKRIFVSQQHDFRYLSSARSYYQQRFDSNYGADFPLVREALGKKQEDQPGFEDRLKKIVSLLKIELLLDSRLIELSNGEGKRVQLAQALLQEPQILILDNPFIGLDVETRTILKELINALIASGVYIFLITGREDIPEGITHVLVLESGKKQGSYERKEFEKLPVISVRENPVSLDLDLLKKLLSVPYEDSFSVAVEMNKVTIGYDEKIILDQLSWKVNKGERWALRGENGSGKSTLLSLITADNPKAYSNEIYLFDRRRGSGESIWDIKKKIGQISPELHIFFHRNTNYTEALSLNSRGVAANDFSSSVTCFEVVCSGFYDQVGSSHELASLQYKYVEEWMALLHISDFKKLPLSTLSLGHQRLVLLARALVKNPPLLILDEPCQGLDPEQTRYFVRMVDEICRHSDKTLIYVSHYVSDIPSCVNKILTLEKGKKGIFTERN